MERSKRLVAYERKINEINENDKKIRILGIVVSSTPEIATIDDGTGVISVRTEKQLTEHGRYRIIGQVFKKGDNKFEMHAEIIQDMKKLNMDLYQKIDEIKRKLKSTN
ncbi:MAG: hypothetical protein ACTSO9_13270 [Candidatus Helarchaeota archaeon]